MPSTIDIAPASHYESIGFDDKCCSPFVTIVIAFAAMLAIIGIPTAMILNTLPIPIDNSCVIIEPHQLQGRSITYGSSPQYELHFKGLRKISGDSCTVTKEVTEKEFMN